MKMTKLFYLGLGWLCMALGGLGIIMPILPTTPFLLVAVWAFSRSSPEMAARLRNNKTFGPYLRDWQDHGVIPVGAKIMAVLMMSGASAYLLGYSDAPSWVGYGATAAMLAVAAYVVTRPSTRKS